MLTFTPEISIIIVNFNTCDLLKDCLISIHEKTEGISYEIIVVDNASDDNSCQMITESFPHVKLLSLKENIGFGRANNEGVHLAQGNVLFFLNSDTLLLNNAIQILHQHLNDKVAICGANLFNKDFQPILSFFYFPKPIHELLVWFPFITYHKSINNHHNPTSNVIEVDCISGADLMIRKDVFCDINGFDPDFFMYYEETELTQRVRKLGYKVCSIPQAQILHYHGMSGHAKNEDLNRWSYQEFWFSKFIYFRKIYCPFIASYIYYLHIIRCLTAIAIFLQNEKKLKYWRNKRLAIKGSYLRYLKKYK